MMGNIPVLKPAQVVGILEKLGFEEVRQRGSHRQFKHPDGRRTTVPFHKGRDLSPVLLRQIARDIGLDVKEFASMMKRTHSFTMIEIVLALGVIVIGVISVLGLFPVGLNASRNAIAESHACEAADQFLHYLEYRIRSDPNGWTTWVWDGSNVGDIPDAMGTPNNAPLSLPAGGMWNDGTMHDIGAPDDGIYKVVTYVDSDDSGDLSTGDIRDFEGIVAVWQEDLVVGGTTVPRNIAAALKVEISWPAQAAHADRKTAVYHYELFNR